MNKPKYKATHIKSLKIVGLFNIFDYNIEFTSEENVLILTGPNGFGKTQILNIIYSLFNQRFAFFFKLVFRKIILELSTSIRIEVEKFPMVTNQSTRRQDEHGRSSNILKEQELHLAFYDGESTIDKINFSLEDSEKQRNIIIKSIFPTYFLNSFWNELRNDQIMALSIKDLLQQYSDQIPPAVVEQIFPIKNPKILEILKSINVHLIKEQRLFKKINNPQKNGGGDGSQTLITETIRSYANELKDIISEKLQESYKLSMSLDITYPQRLIKENKKITQEEYAERLEHIKKIKLKLIKNGLYETEDTTFDFNEGDAKALLIYLDDLEKKLGFFDDLLYKLELFTGILNERRFTYKSIAIDKARGFCFKTIDNQYLELSELSSGEQHEVVLLYELIFKTKPDTFVLIDEPEISLHVSWQKEFIKDLLKIMEIQDFHVLIATHSPTIINDRWDLVYNLEKRELDA